MLESLANAGPALTRSLSVLPTFPFPKETIDKWHRGDYANLTAIIDLTLSRIDASFFTGTRWEGELTGWSCSGAAPSANSPARTPARRQPADRPVPLGSGAVTCIYTRRIKIQLAIFTVIALIALAFMAFSYMKLPAKFFGVGRYTVTVELPRSRWALRHAATSPTAAPKWAGSNRCS